MSEKYMYLRKGSWKACQTGTKNTTKLVDGQDTSILPGLILTVSAIMLSCGILFVMIVPYIK